MNNYIRESFTKQYWLHEIYPQEIRQAHINGDFHIHDLGFFGPYCCGWDLYQLAVMGFGGVPGKVTSKPAKHLRSFLGQIVNATFSTQGESAGAQAWSSIDTYCAPFIRADALTYAQVKQALQEFVFNLNVPTRVGFQSPFSNLSFDLKVPSTLTAKNAIVGGLPLDTCYGDYQKEMDLFNLAFCEVMIEGDASGRVFTFPIPTYNITKEFAWDGPVSIP
jgi:ribonucleoside-triphosphate reductase